MKFLRLCARAFGWYVAAVAVLGIFYVLVPPVSTLMLGRWVTLNAATRDYEPLKNVSRHVLSAVVSAEDDAFCRHWGVDWKSMSEAIADASEGERVRGASTISMQVAKNLFLWPQRSFLRKSLEVPIAFYLEVIWSKRRMMEVYLSIAEWGEGVFGVEAASQRYFGKPASRLSEWEAALLASALPNPRGRNPAQPSAYQRGYAQKILSRMKNGADLSCF